MKTRADVLMGSHSRMTEMAGTGPGAEEAALRNAECHEAYRVIEQTQ